MCTSAIGVAKRIDLESISEDLSELIKQLDRNAEGEISVAEIHKIEKKLNDIIRE
jgi:hypothetical protein